MENKKTCADCVNLGRAVYCMQCKRLKTGYKDMFVEQKPQTEHKVIKAQYKPLSDSQSGSVFRG